MRKAVAKVLLVLHCVAPSDAQYSADDYMSGLYYKLYNGLYYKLYNCLYYKPYNGLYYKLYNGLCY